MHCMFHVLLARQPLSVVNCTKKQWPFSVFNTETIRMEEATDDSKDLAKEVIGLAEFPWKSICNNFNYIAQ